MFYGKQAEIFMISTKAPESVIQHCNHAVSDLLSIKKTWLYSLVNWQTFFSSSRTGGPFVLKVRGNGALMKSSFLKGSQLNKAIHFICRNLEWLTLVDLKCK